MGSIFDFVYSELQEIYVAEMALLLVAAAFCGIVISFTYMRVSKNAYAQSFVTTLVMLPVIMAAIILFVGSNVARAFSLAGTLSIIRFRSAPGEPHDIGYVFFDIAAGLACGVGFWLHGIIFAVVLCIFLFALSYFNYGQTSEKYRIIKITVPEDLNFSGMFDDIFKKYTERFSLHRVKTTNLGELFEVVYYVSLKDVEDEKQLIDELRTRNGNLPINSVMGQA